MACCAELNGKKRKEKREILRLFRKEVSVSNAACNIMNARKIRGNIRYNDQENSQLIGMFNVNTPKH